ncbi:hypothetical protein [Olivibacter domesticus]|uniref:Uncharacterized protein n=1 Tax=Olivibacter domesticus TaxID=407022 RepID=A0A1H7KZX9_OLID1|nr:hypothetical protein [Olivibacter domesticus]SEK92341.1 hypothetical protein SAMN05661044_01517 [Olivibacter domesticus]
MMIKETPMAGEEHASQDFWFPGRWIGGISLIIAPLALLAGILIRIQFHFFFPQQLEAFEQHPTLVSTSYNFFVAGNILLWPAIITLARYIGIKKRQWALWGGSFVIFGLFARSFHAGVDHFAFQLVGLQGLDMATKTVADSYGVFHIISTLNGTIIFGWIILAIGSYLSGTLGLIRSIALACMSALMIGVLKGSSIVSIIATLGLCVALVPLGIHVLKDGPGLSYKTIGSWLLLIAAVIVCLFLFGQAG